MALFKKKKGAVIKFAKVNEKLEIKVDEIKKLITNKTKMIAITHISNVTGGISPLNEIIDLASSKIFLFLLMERRAYLKLDMQKLDCDFYVISCHKLYGPNGLGIIIRQKKKWLDVIPPYRGGGGMINEVKENISFAESLLNLKQALCKQQK